MSTKLTVAEYFAGVGLVGLGLGPSWEVTFANDIDPKKYEMYVEYFGESAPYLISDINSIAVDNVPHTTLATASFPCIDLSLAGNGLGLDGKHSGTFWGFIRILTEMQENRPRIVMLENVLGWLSAKGGKDFRQSIEALNNLGYVCDAFMLNANHFTPQSRPRMFVIGVRDYPRLDELPLLAALNNRSKYLVSKRLLDSIWLNRDLAWTVHQLPAPPSLTLKFDDVAERLPDDDERWWSREKVEHIWSQMTDSHRQRVALMQESDQIVYATAYKRIRQRKTRAEIRNDGLAGCLRTPGGGSSKQIVFAAGRGDFKVRWMTAREYARLQGVPDEFPLTVPYLQALKGFGDAVCVPVISWISDNLLTPLAEESLVSA